MVTEEGNVKINKFDGKDFLFSKMPILDSKRMATFPHVSTRLHLASPGAAPDACSVRETGSKRI